MKILIALFLILLPYKVLTQPPPPAVGNSKDKPKAFKGWDSITTIPARDGFVSLDGKFKIALPKSIQGYSAVSPNQTGGRATGEEFTWKFAEGEIVALYLDFPTASPESMDLARITERMKASLVAKYPSAKLLQEGSARSTPPAYSFYAYDLGTQGILSTHLFLHGKRLFQFNAAFKDPSLADRVNRVVTTFELVSQEQVDVAIRKAFDDLKPQPLPQSPVVAKLTSDVEDDGLKGKVKQVVTENEDQSDTWSVQGRKLSSVDYYDHTGAQTRQDLYDYRGRPFQVTVYGYIDGKRVSSSKLARYESDPPPLMAITAGGAKPARKFDPRYEYSFEYKYENGKLTERQMLHSDGSKGMRYAYKHSPGKIEELVYSEDGKLNQHYVQILDANGTEIEQTYVDVLKVDHGDRRYKYSYEFDTTGNWTKRTTLRAVTENGKVKWEPYAIYYRTISYY